MGKVPLRAPPAWERGLHPQSVWRVLLVKTEKDGPVIPAVDTPLVEGSDQGVLDLRSDPASLRDMAARLRDTAEMTPDPTSKARLTASAREAEAMAENVEAAALWIVPGRRW